MTTALPVLPLPRHGSSGSGISYYSQVIKCPRKAALDVELAGTMPERTEGAAPVGTIVHQMDELYYGGVCANPAVIQVSDVNWGDAVSEARRLWEAYIKRFPGVNWWGNVIAVEEQYPVGQGQEVLVESVMGVTPFTVRIDRVIEVTTESSERIAKHTDLGYIKPGVYLYDRKTKGKADGDAQLVHFNSMQFAAYQMVYNACHPTDQALGMIVDEIISTKEVKFRQFLVTPPDEYQQRAVRSMITNAKALEKSNACFGVAYGCKDYNRFCPHLTSGVCKRS